MFSKENHETNSSKDYIYVYLVNLTYNLVSYIQFIIVRTQVMDQGSFMKNRLLWNTGKGSAVHWLDIH